MMMKKRKISLILAVVMILTVAFGLLSACANEEIKVNVHFDLNYTGAPEYSQEREVIIGSNYGELPTPTRQNYRFDGWYINSRLDGDPLTAKSTVAEFGDHTLYAKWVATKSVTVTYKSRGNTIDEITYMLEEKYGLNIPNVSGSITEGGIKKEFKYWYAIDEQDRKVIITESSYVRIGVDHDVIAFYDVIKSEWTFDTKEDSLDFLLGVQYASKKSDNSEVDYSSVSYHSDKKALILTPTNNDISRLSSKMNYTLQNNWEITYSLEIECNSSDENKELLFYLVGKYGGEPTNKDLEFSKRAELLSNGMQFDVTGRTTRNGDYELFLIVDGLGNLSKPKELVIFINTVYINRDPGPMPTVREYDMGSSVGRGLLAMGNQWAGGSDGQYTSIVYDSTKNAVRVSTFNNQSTVLWVLVYYYSSPAWVAAGTEITWEFEIDAHIADPSKTVTVALRGAPVGDSITYETFGDELMLDYVDGSHSITGITPKGYNRHYLGIDISELSEQERLEAVFYIKKVIIDTAPEGGD